MNRNNKETPPILASEVHHAIVELKNEKMPGEDGICNKYIKWSSEHLSSLYSIEF